MVYQTALSYRHFFSLQRLKRKVNSELHKSISLNKQKQHPDRDFEVIPIFAFRVQVETSTMV
jgi:hypothetical protein